MSGSNTLLELLTWSGHGRAARGLVPPDEPLFALVSPGNAASLRAFLAAGYRPIGAEVLFRKAGSSIGTIP